MQNFGSLLSIFSANQQSTPTEKQSSGDTGGFNKILESLMQNASAEMLRKTGISTGAQKLIPIPDGDDVVSEDMISAKVSDINEILENLIMQIKAETPASGNEINFDGEDITAELESIFADFAASDATETDKMDAMIKYINGLMSASESEPALAQGQTGNEFKDLLNPKLPDAAMPKTSESTIKNNTEVHIQAPELPVGNDTQPKDTPKIATVPVQADNKLTQSEPAIPSGTTDVSNELPKQHGDTKLTQAEPTAKQQTDVSPVASAEKGAFEQTSTTNKAESNTAEVKQAVPLSTERPTPVISQNVKPSEGEAVTAKAPAEQLEKNTASVEKNSRINIIESAVADSKKQPESVKPADMQQTEQKQEVKTTSTDQRESLRAEAYNKSSLSGDAANSGGQKSGGDSGAFLKSSIGAVTEQVKTGDTNTETKGMTFDSAMKQTADTTKTAESADIQRSRAYDLTDAKDISRLINKIYSTATKGETKLTVTLTPENMGRLEIRLTETAGRLTAKLVADNEAAHKLMVSNADAIKSQLSEKGIVIDNMEFSFSDTSKQESNENKRASSKHTSKKAMKDDDGETFELGKEIATDKDRGLYA